MTTFAPAVPGSPPDLSGSKSSKSSSLHSSSLNSNHDGALADIAHFEDIGLEDDHRGLSQQDIYGYDIFKYPPHIRNGGGRGNLTSTMTAMRDLTAVNAKRPGFPSLHGQVMGALSHNAAHSLNPPVGGGLKRSPASPHTRSLGMRALTGNRSRSASPSHAEPRPKSSKSVQTGSPLTRQGASPGHGPPSRRGSWQPSRKTVKELEEEYHDSDEDLPDDASLWNVPLSPRPPQERTISAAASANASTSNSPERYPKSPLGQAMDFGMRKMVTTTSAMAPSDTEPNHGESMPRTSFGTKTRQDDSMSALPETNSFPMDRAKSWTAAISQLSEEAKSLTDALEVYASVSEQQHEAQVQSGISSENRPNLAKMQHARTSMPDLPPLRKNNVMIDPLPISREKERVLSRTRPSWLPPKSQKEEKKHVKEYQRMMAMAQENGMLLSLISNHPLIHVRDAEKRRAARVNELQCARDDTKSSLLRIWDEHVLPNWDITVRQPRTRELWWRGIAPKSRGEVWQRAVGNDLALTDGSYRKALRRAKEMEREVQEGNTGREREKQWFKAIKRDIADTYPDLRIFQAGGPLSDSLADVLMAYSMYRSDVGYSHGTHVSLPQHSLPSSIAPQMYPPSLTPHRSSSPPSSSLFSPPPPPPSSLSPTPSTDPSLSPSSCTTLAPCKKPTPSPPTSSPSNYPACTNTSCTRWPSPKVTSSNPCSAPCSPPA